MEAKEARTIQPREKALSAAEAAEDHKALDLRILEVSTYCDYADYFIIMTATSTRHARALADAISEKTRGRPSSPEGYTAGEWVLLDLGDVVVHIFHEPLRHYYNFDKLWGHVPVLDGAALKMPSRKTHDARPQA